MNAGRRSFIRYSSLAAAGSLAGLRPFGALNALAQSTAASTDYKALVCIFHAWLAVVKTLNSPNSLGHSNRQ